MALFKILKGDSSNLPSKLTEGYCYVTQDNGKFYIDVTGTKRIVLNSETADGVPHALINKGTTATTAANDIYGIVGVDSGNRIFTRVIANLHTGSKTLVDGMIIAIRLPVAGKESGVGLSIDGGITYHPLAYGSAYKLTSHFSTGSAILLMYDASSSCSVYGTSTGAPSTSAVNIKGVWRVLNLWTDGNTYTSAYCGTAAATAAK